MPKIDRIGYSNVAACGALFWGPQRGKRGFY